MPSVCIEKCVLSLILDSFDEAVYYYTLYNLWLQEPPGPDLANHETTSFSSDGEPITQGKSEFLTEIKWILGE